MARTLFMVLYLTGCTAAATPPGPDAGGGGEPEGGAGGQTGGSGGSGGSVGTGGAGGSPGTDAAPSTAEPDAALATDGASPPAERPPSPSGPGKIVLVAGGGSGGDGSPAVMASTNRPFGAVSNPLNGDVYIAEVGGGGRIRRIDDKGIISTVIGAGAAGPGGRITLRQPHNLLFQPKTHHLFVGDTFAQRIIRMDTATGEVTVFAGAGSQVAPNLARTYCLAFDAEGRRLYVTGNGVTIIDLQTLAVSRVNTSTPRVIAVDSRGNLYLGGGTSLQVVDPMGKISAVMGSGGLANPKHLSTDLDDNVIITDTESDTIRKYVLATKSVVKIAGSGGNGGGTLGGSPEAAALARPHGAYVDEQGRMLIADSFNNRVLRIDY